MINMTARESLLKILVSHTTFDLVLQNSLTLAATGPGNLDFGTYSLPKLPKRLTSSSLVRQLVSPRCNHGPTPNHLLFSANSKAGEFLLQRWCKGKGECREKTVLPVHLGPSRQGLCQGSRAVFSSSCPCLLLIGLCMRSLAPSHCSYKQVLPPGRAEGKVAASCRIPLEL